jgi:hypothetical protein
MDTIAWPSFRATPSAFFARARQRASITTLCVALAHASACGSPPSLDVGSDDGGNRPRDARDAGDGGRCAEGATVSCACDGGVGTRVCTAGSYGACMSCLQESTAPLLCVPGVYVGTATGRYNGGISGLISGFWVDTMNGMRLNLQPSGGQGAEFVTVNSGCLQGLYLDGGVDNRAGGMITGSVDCRTGHLDGVIRNTSTALNIAGQEVRVYQKGPIHAVYDPKTRSFRGTWEEHEPPNKILGDVPGGSGEWTATLSDAGVPTNDESTFKDCWGYDFPDDLFPDAGG